MRADRRGGGRWRGPHRRMIAAALALAGLSACAGGADDPGPAAVDACASRAQEPAPAAWPAWQAVIYQRREPAQLAGLKRMGVTAGMVLASRDDAAPAVLGDPAASLLQQGLRWYVENIATDFYAAYHRWRPHAPVNAAFLEAKARHRRDPLGTAAFLREPSLSDPIRLRRIGERVARTVRLHAPYRPLHYDLADEPGIGDLAAAWDFDLSPASLTGMRAWLRTQYGSLAALNGQWGTAFTGWDEIVPETTDQALRRTDGNFSSWADFKAWMDVAFARAIRSGTDAVHAADPQALAGIAGAQIPGWGGYDYTRLAHAVDVMEIYDFGRSVDIARSLNPSLVLLTTLYGGGARQLHGLWRGVLRGARGVILWDERDELVNRDGSPGTWGRALAPVLRELRDGLGAFLIGSRRELAPVAILYSPPSFRTQWLLDRQPQGPAWAGRDAAAEYEDNTVAAATEGFARLLGRLGLQPRFLSPAVLGDGALRGSTCRVLILPRAVALAPAEVAAIRGFVGSGGTVIADVVPGRFDEHSRRRDRSPLQDLFRATRGGQGRAVLFQAGGAVEPERLELFGQLLEQAGAGRDFALETPAGRPATDLEVYRFRHGGLTVLALLRDIESTTSAEPVTLALRRPCLVYDLRARRALGRVSRVPLTPAAAEPVLLALSGAACPSRP